MKLINEVLGFSVLAGPLWVIVVLLIVGAWFAIVAAKRLSSAIGKVVVGLVVFVFVLGAPFADEIAGRLYLRHLCNTEAGVRVHQTVQLPAEFWYADGRPKFYDERNGNFSLKGYRVVYADGTYSTFPRIENAGYKRLDESGRVLGETTDFLFRGGWLRRNVSPHVTATGCNNRRKHSLDLVTQIFRKASSE